MNLSVRFPIDTRELSDGWHELACVAYEGSCVRTQTRVNLPVFVNNSSWNTTFSITEFGSSNSPLTLNSATYHARVMADSTNISAIHLYGPGGLIATAHTQADVVFPIDSSFFGPGTHRFYSIIEKADGSSYRTEEATVRFANSHL